MAYNNPAGILTGTIIMQILSTVCVALRFYSRRWKRTQILTSDWLILAGLACGTGLTAIEIYGVAIKALAHPLNATIEDPRAVGGRLNKAKHLELSLLLLGILALGLIKLSISFLYWQLFAKVMFRRVILCWILILIAWTTSFIVAGLLECGSHLKALFGTPKEYLDHCGSAIPTGWAYVGSDIATDFITLVIPIPVVLSLQLSTSRKVMLIATFMIGALSIGASVAKAYIYIDAILLLTSISIWNLTEVHVGIIAACGPTLRPILSHPIAADTVRLLLTSVRGSRTEKASREETELPPFVKMDSTTELHLKAKDSAK